MKKKKQIAIITIIIMLLNMFFPYVSLFNNISYAGTGVLEENPLIVNNLGITTKGSNRILKVELALVSEAVINGFDLQFKVDTSKLVPCNKTTGAESSAIGMIMQQSDYYMGNIYTRTYDSNTKTFHFLAAEPAGGTDIVENGYVPGETGDPAIDENGAGYPAYYPVLTLSFKIVDDTLTAENIPLDVFTLSSAGAGLPTGLKVNYTNETGVRVSKDLQLAGKGFAEPEKEIDSITVQKDPDNTTYEHGDALDLTGGIIKVTYTDQSTEEIAMTDVGVSIKSGSQADVDNQTVTIEYKGKETSFDITVTDPIQSLKVSNPMNKIEYNHGDSIDFSGLELTVTKKSGATETLTKDSQGVTTSEEEASVNSSKFTQTSPEGEVPVKGKQQIEFTYQGKTATQTIIVNDTISSIEVTSQPNKTIYKYGESLDLSGAVVKVTLASGAETNIDLPDGSVKTSTYSNTTIGTKQNLSITMGDKTATNTIDIEVYNYVTSSQLTEPIKVDYKYNEELSVAGGRLRLTWADGDVTNVNLTTDMVTGYDKTKIDVQTLTVTYNFNYELSDGQQIPDEIVKTYEVQVTNPAKSIEITPPTKTEYNHGDNLDLAGGKIVVTYENNTTKDIQMTTDMIKEANGGNVNMSPEASEYTEYELSKILKITYQEDEQTKTVDYPITIKNNVKSIAMNELPTDTQYDINDTEYKLDGGSIKVIRAAGDIQTISLTDRSITLTELSTLTTTSGNKTVTVTYEEKTTTFQISVENGVKSIEITPPTKTEYNHGGNLDLAGGRIKVNYADKTSKNINLSEDMITETTTSLPVDMTPEVAEYVDNKLTKNLTITYSEDGITEKVTYDITIKNPIDKIEIETSPKTEYKLNESIVGVGGTIIVTRKAGNTETVNIQDSMVSNLSTTTAGNNKTARITYTDDGVTKTVDYKYNVIDNVTSIEITPPTKTEYSHGDTLDLASGSIKVNYASGTSSTVEMEQSMIKEEDGSNVNMSPSSYDSTNKVSKTLKISYEQGGIKETVDYPITIINKIQSIEIQGTPQKEYNINDEFQDNLSILVNRQTGLPEAIEVTEDMITGFRTDEEGTRTVTITYEENGETKTVEYEYTVKDKITSVVLKTQPNKNVYEYGDNLNLEGATIEVTKGSGKTTIQVTQEMVSGYNPEQLGDQELIVTYEGIEATDKIKVKVNDKIIGIELTAPTKKKYEIGDELDLTGGKITTIMASGADGQEIALTDDMVKGFDSKTPGPKELTVTYGEFNKNFTVIVSDEVTSIDITTSPKSEYEYGEALGNPGGILKVTYQSGATIDVNITADMITELGGEAFNSNVTFEIGKTTYEKELKVTYEGCTDTYPITIINKIQSIEIQGIPQKEYNINDEFQDNLSILVNRQTGLPEAIEVTEEMLSGFRTDEEGTRTVTITYEENGETKTVEYEYTVTDKITSVVLKTQPNKTVYEYGDNLNLEGATIEVAKGSGKTTIPVTKEMVTGYNPEQLGGQELTVTYGGIKATDKINVTVNDKVIGIELTAPNKTKYEIGDELDLAGGKITTIMASGADGQEIALTDDMVKGFDSKTEGQKELTVTYGEFSEKFTVTVSDEIKGIDLEGTPKTEYIYGEEFDISDLELIVHKSSGDVRIPVTQDMVKGYDKTQEGEQKVTIEYEGQVVTEIEVNVKNPVQKLEWITKPKTAYVVKDELDVTGGKIKATKADGTYEEISLTKEMVTGYNPDQLGNQTLTVTYEDQTLTYVINVTDRAQSITIVEEPKKNYLYGEELVAGGKLEVTKLSGEKETIDITPDMISGYNPDQLGNQTLTISYGGVETTFEVNVKDYIKEVVITPPSKIEYNYGENLDLSDAKVTIVMASTPDKSQTIPVTSNMISGYNPQVIGPQTVTITYTADGKEYKQSFGVTVEDTIKSVTLQDTGFKTQYLYGENLDLDGLSLNVNYSSGRTENIPVTSGMVDGYNPNQVGSQTLTITYEGFKQNKEVNVKDYVEDITLTPPTKTEYKIGEALSLVEGSITEKMASGANGKVISLTQDMVKGFDSTTPGVKTITVTYNNGEKTFQKTFQVAVINTVNHIEVIPPTKTEYKYGENLNLAGGSVKVVMEDGTINNVPITQDMVTGYQKTTPGQQMITVTYTDEKGETFTGYFNVTVGEDYIVKYQFTAPTKKEYNIGETIDLTGGAITEVYASGKLGNKVELTNSMISGFESTTPGTKKITVTYEGNNYYYNIVVKDKVLGISIKDLPNKLEYKQGESLDLTGATLNVVKMSGTSVVNITSDMVSGYDPTQAGIQTITVTYEGFTAQFSVYIEKESTTPSTPEDNTPEDKPNIPSDGNDNGTNNKGTNNNRTNTDNASLISNEDNENSQDSNTEESQNLDKEQDNTGAIIGSTDNDDNNADGGAILRTILNLIALLFALAGITLIIIAIVKDRKNVKIYLEEGNERVLVGKEKVTKNERVLDLNKYYNKYKEDEYKIVLSKSISKKLDKKTVNLIVHDKQESFTVDYNNEAYTYKT